MGVLVQLWWSSNLVVHTLDSYPISHILHPISFWKFHTLFQQSAESFFPGTLHSYVSIRQITLSPVFVSLADTFHTHHDSGRKMEYYKQTSSKYQGKITGTKWLPAQAKTVRKHWLFGKNNMEHNFHIETHFTYLFCVSLFILIWKISIKLLIHYISTLTNTLFLALIINMLHPLSWVHFCFWYYFLQFGIALQVKNIKISNWMRMNEMKRKSASLEQNVYQESSLTNLSTNKHIFWKVLPRVYFIRKHCNSTDIMSYFSDLTSMKNIQLHFGYVSVETYEYGYKDSVKHFHHYQKYTMPVTK